MSEAETGGLESIGDLLLFLSAIILVFVSLIFFQLYLRYKKRDHIVMGLTILVLSFQMIITELHFLGDSGLLEFLGGLFSFIMALGIVFILISPERVPHKFEKELLNQAEEE